MLLLEYSRHWDAFVLCFQIIGKFDKELTKSIQDDYKDNAGSWDAVQKEVSCF